jgi:L-ascorbate metabolism protein UlaG (beta-lactamase superfamily)
MKEPFQKDEAFLADVESTRGLRDGSFRLWWLGQSGFLLQFHGRHVLFDPYLSDSLTLKYAHTDKAHVRITKRVIDPARLAFIVDVATSSHNHTDHLDADTICPIVRLKDRGHEDLTLFISPANEALARDRLKGGLPCFWTIDVGEWRQCEGFEFTAVPAAHPDMATDESGDPFYIGFVVRFERWTVYHAGDTKLYAGMADLLRPFKVDLALLPINGDQPERRVAGNLNGREAAQLAKDIGAKIVIPCHYDMFEFNTADPKDEFVPECERIGQAYRVLQLGERFSSSEIPR